MSYLVPTHSSTRSAKPVSAGSSPVRVSMVIATTCDAGKRAPLERAIDSIMCQRGVELDLIVVANGHHVDAELFADLQRDPRLSVLALDQGHVALARRHGLSVASGDYFGFLDDDDELLPDALSRRVTAFAADSSIDVVVTNGLIRGNVEYVHVPSGFEESIRDDLCASFLVHNWFASPASLFRSATVPLTVFDIPYTFYEWTYLFFRLLSESKKIRYVDDITYRKFEDSPHAVSKSHAYRLAEPAFLMDMMRLPSSVPVRKALKSRYVVALNGCSASCLARGDVRGASAYHLRCLRTGGWRYLPYSRKILAAWILGSRVARLEA